jgi:DNA uptake protein ComE-like DNA-binding protein
MRILLVTGIMAGGTLALWYSGSSSSAEGMIAIAPPQTILNEPQKVELPDRSAPIQAATAPPSAPAAVSAIASAAADATPKDTARAPTAATAIPLTADQAKVALQHAQAALEEPAPPVPVPPTDMDMTGAVTQQASAAEPYVPAGESADTLVDLNKAPFEQLNSLKGAGALGRAIIKGRPYKSVDDLVKKKVLRRTAFERIRNQVTVQ